jgi:Domain of unknown function (DUF4386)
MDLSVPTGPFTSLQRSAARIVGFLYLFTNATAIVAFVGRLKLIVPRDAAQTSANIMASEGLFRFGIANEIVTVVGVLVLVWGLYVILKSVDQNVAWLATFLRLAENFFLAFITIQELTALALLKGGATAQGFDPQQLHGLSYTFLRVYGDAFNIGFVFLGLGSAVFSYLWWKSRYIPRLLAGWGIFASLLMAVVSLAIIVVPSLARLGLIHMMPMGLYEFGLGFWLLIKGIRQPTMQSTQ